MLFHNWQMNIGYPFFYFSLSIMRKLAFCVLCLNNSHSLNMFYYHCIRVVDICILKNKTEKENAKKRESISPEKCKHHLLHMSLIMYAFMQQNQFSPFVWCRVCNHHHSVYKFMDLFLFSEMNEIGIGMNWF